jgi:hypothetical protein
VNGFPEKVLLATDGLENRPRPSRTGQPSISRRRAMRRRVPAKGETMKRLHPSLSLPTSIVFLLIAVWARILRECLVRKRDNPFS